MKIISLLFTVLFLFVTTSVAQIRYAVTNPSEMAPILLNLAMAFCIYMVFTNIKLPKNFRIKSNHILGIKKQSNKVYKVS